MQLAHSNAQLEKLQRRFEDVSTALELIRKLDEYQMTDGTNLFDLFSELCVYLKNITGARFAEVYQCYDHKLYATGIAAPLPEADFLCSEVLRRKLAVLDKPIIEEVVLENGFCVPLLIPIIVREKPYGAVLIASIDSVDIDALKRGKLNETLNAIPNHLGLIIEKLENQSQQLRQRELIDTFFDDKLKPSDCWRQIINWIVKCLPNSPSLRISVAPKVQLLLYSPGDLHLRIKATHGNEPLDTHVRVANSICGLVVEDLTKDYVYLDPTEHLHRYFAFLGDKEHIPRSELAVAIKENGRVIGVLNLEHPQASVFQQPHIDAIVDAAKFLSPFLSAMEARYESQRTKQIGLLYVMSKLLKRVEAQYRHRLGQPLVEARFILEDLKKATETADNMALVHGLLSELSTHVNALQQHAEAFCKNLPRVLAFGPQKLNTLIGLAVLDLRNNKLVKQGRVLIIWLENQDTEWVVFASPLLREHIYDILNNSLYQVSEAIESGKIECGQITISTGKEVIQDNRDKASDLEYAWISIADNGGGIPSEHRSKVGQFGFTTKGGVGSGRGIATAHDYLTSLGGRLILDDNPSPGLTVSFYLQVYNPNVHKDELMPLRT